MNIQLCEIPSSQEIWEAICNLLADRVPEIDAFTRHFFCGCWQIIHYDMIAIVQGFFLRDIADYRPISLSTFASKVVSKILATQFSRILSLLMSNGRVLLREGVYTN